MKIQRLSNATITDITIVEEGLVTANVTYAGKTRRVEFLHDIESDVWRASAVFGVTVGRGTTVHPISIVLGWHEGEWGASLPPVVVRNRQATVRGWMEDLKMDLAGYYTALGEYLKETT